MKFERISADAHIDLHWLPADLFTKNATSGMKERMPFVVDAEDPYWMSRKGTWLGYVSGFGPYGQKYVPGGNAKIDIMAATGLYSDAAKGRRRVSDPVLRQEDMDRDGVDAEVVYGLSGETLLRMEDPEAVVEMSRIYNDWLVDFCKGSSGRLYGLAAVHDSNVEAAIREAKRIAEYRSAGIVGINLAVTRDTLPLWHSNWEPLWHTLADLRLPLHVHCFRSLPLTLEEVDVEGKPRREAFFTSVTGFQMSLVHPLAALMGSGVFERYPTFQLVLGESSLSWLPYVIQRMDHEFATRFKDLKLKMKPSEYWRRQCKACFQKDKIGLKLINELGVETVLWGSDYPHADGTWPESSKLFAEEFSSLPAKVMRSITYENTGRFYGILKD